MKYALQFKTGEWFVGAEDLHDTTWSHNLADATLFDSGNAAQWYADAMMRTQGISLNVISVR